MALSTFGVFKGCFCYLLFQKAMKVSFDHKRQSVPPAAYTDRYKKRVESDPFLLP